MGSSVIWIDRAAQHRQSGPDLLEPFDHRRVDADDLAILVDDGDQLLRPLRWRDIGGKDVEALPEGDRVGFDLRVIEPPGRAQLEAGDQLCWIGSQVTLLAMSTLNR